jgi:serine protease Do
LAILKVNTKGEKLPTLPFGDSDGLEVGDLVLAFGNPYGFSQSVTSGIVSALSRSKSSNDYGTFIQTDAAINPGNSGGALVSMSGQLVGINSWIASPTGSYVGIGFAIPSNLVKAVLTSITQTGKVVHAFIGLSGQALTQDLAQTMGLSKPGGVLISQVSNQGPASQAGIKPGDVIIAVNGKLVEDPEGMRFRLATLPIGSDAHITFLRDGIEKSTDIHLLPPPENPPRDTSEIKGRNPLAGATIANINPALAEEKGIPPESRGVIVMETRPGSTADRYGFQPLDLLLAVNDKPLASVADAKALLNAPVPGWRIKINREGQTLSLTVNQ